MSAIASKTTFALFTKWIEGSPHGLPHMNIGFSMSSMWSPDDPIFWLHHGNVDRLYHFWIDCQEYENIPANSIGENQYKAMNPTSGTRAARNPYTGSAYIVTATTSMPYSFGYSRGIVQSLIFPRPWPTPKQMWPTLTGGYNGLNVRYGPDSLVSAFGTACTKNRVWSIVNYVAKKRSTSDDGDGAASLNPRLKVLADRFQSDVAAGQPHHEVLKKNGYGRMSECSQIENNGWIIRLGKNE